MKTYKPGQIAKVSGQYPLIGPRGGHQGREITVVAGKPFPPTQKPGYSYGSPDVTKHKGN